MGTALYIGHLILQGITYPFRADWRGITSRFTRAA